MDVFKKVKREMTAKIFMCALVYIFVVILSLYIGRIKISFKDILFMFMNAGHLENMNEMIVLRSRFIRLAAASLVGAAISVSGACYQGTFQNPLVSPDLLGVSAGACVGAALSILLGVPYGYVQIFAFIGGVGAVFLATTIPKFFKDQKIYALVLAGIIVSGLFNSILGLIKYLADPETQLPAITHWQLGSIQLVGTDQLAYIIFPILGCLIIAYFMRWNLNILSLGEEDAKTLGINLNVVKNIIIVIATVLTASSVCLTGTISWIGLVVPHFARLLVGNDYRKSLPVTILIGAGILTLIDTLARSLTSAELPLGIFTGIIGAPSYFYFLYAQRKGR